MPVTSLSSSHATFSSPGPCHFLVHISSLFPVLILGDLNLYVADLCSTLTPASVPSSTLVTFVLQHEGHSWTAFHGSAFLKDLKRGAVLLRPGPPHLSTPPCFLTPRQPVFVLVGSSHFLTLYNSHSLLSSFHLHFQHTHTHIYACTCLGSITPSLLVFFLPTPPPPSPVGTAEPEPESILHAKLPSLPK